MTADRPRYRLTPKARADLEDVWRYGAETWSPDRADRYIDDLVVTIELLAAMPELARERRELSPPVRIHPHARSVIVYSVEPDAIRVIRILGGGQDWRAVLEQLDRE